MSRESTAAHKPHQELQRLLDDLGLAPAQFAWISGTRQSHFDEMLRGTRIIPPAIWTMAALLQLPGAIAVARSTSASATYGTFDEVMTCAVPRAVSDRATSAKPRKRTNISWHRQFGS
jgi:hypothetical protein